MHDPPRDTLGLAVSYGLYDGIHNQDWGYCRRSDRLSSHIGINWGGKPLRTLDMMLAHIRGTRTSTALMVKGFPLEGIDETRECLRY